MKRLLFGTLLILSLCASTYKIIGGHGVAIITFGFLAFYSLCVFCYVRWQARMTIREDEAKKPAELDITERHYHDGIEVIAHICVN
jgi:hypothetical protein